MQGGIANQVLDDENVILSDLTLVPEVGVRRAMDMVAFQDEQLSAVSVDLRAPMAYGCLVEEYYLRILMVENNSAILKMSIEFLTTRVAILVKKILPSLEAPEGWARENLELLQEGIEFHEQRDRSMEQAI